jgi:phosphatidylglycerol:prolipoprotein diacylglycerol transferase
MEYWQNIYANFDRVAFDLGFAKVYWYGLMYVFALLIALYIAKWIIKKDNLDITQEQMDSFFIYIEIGAILGARLGYILFYDPNTMYYLTNPWQIFNPFVNGQFVGISGMSYHGALVGILIGSLLFAKRYKKSFWFLMDIIAIATPLGYVFGRIGNFLNQELFGRVTDVPWGIYVDGVLRHPSQLYEAFLEGVVLFVILYWYRNKKRFDGELIIIYAIGYGIARIIAEFYRQPDFQLGFICCDMITMGQVLSFSMVAIPVGVWVYLNKKQPNNKLI